MTDLVLSALKLVALAIAGTLGVVGIIGETRDSRRHLTRWGKIALMGIIASTLVAGITQALEVIRDKQEAEKKAREARRTVEEIRSPLMPPGRMTVSFALSLNLNHPKLNAYEHRIGALLKPVLGLENPPDPPTDTYWLQGPDVMTRRASVVGAHFGRRSPFFPALADGELLSIIFNDFGIEGYVQAETQAKEKTLRFQAFSKDGKAFYEYRPSEREIRFDV
jgi:hypothetical protein